MGGVLVNNHLSVKGIHISICKEMEGVNGRFGIGQRCSTFNCSSGDFVHFGREMRCNLQGAFMQPEFMDNSDHNIIQPWNPGEAPGIEEVSPASNCCKGTS